jgi:hypothetical protein
VNATTVINSAFVPVPVKLLIDVGNSDLAFQDVSNKIKVPTNNFDDYLGKGFGDVIGKRARIEGF